MRKTHRIPWVGAQRINRNVPGPAVDRVIKALPTGPSSVLVRDSTANHKASYRVHHVTASGWVPDVVSGVMNEPCRAGWTILSWRLHVS